jgi:hypothetical protein
VSRTGRTGAERRAKERLVGHGHSVGPRPQTAVGAA